MSDPKQSNTKAAFVLADAMRQLGVTRVFGLPGGGSSLDLIEGAKASGLPVAKAVSGTWRVGTPAIDRAEKATLRVLHQLTCHPPLPSSPPPLPSPSSHSQPHPPPSPRPSSTASAGTSHSRLA